MRSCRKLMRFRATIREQAGPDVTPEALEAERETEQKKINECKFAFRLRSNIVLIAPTSAKPLTEEEMAETEGLISQGFQNWSRRDFQQFVRALKNYGWHVNHLRSIPFTHIFLFPGRTTTNSSRVRLLTRRVLTLRSTIRYFRRSGIH